VELSLDTSVLKKQKSFELKLIEICDQKSTNLTLFNDDPFNELIDDEPKRLGPSRSAI